MADKASELTAAEPLARALAAHAPAGWQRVDAVFALTVMHELALAVYSDGARAVSAAPPDMTLELARDLRAQAAASSAGPWWRMLVTLTSSGQMDVSYDYGEQPFPKDQTFAPEVYRADLETYPRDNVPVWLAAYIGHGDRQRRSPQQAAVQTRADRDGRIWAVLAESEFPPLSVMWARWATIAAAFVAAQSDRGPRMLVGTAVFEGAAGGGATLRLLPGERAVLSGGVWNAPALDAVYNGGAPMPNLYAGAPEWVADPVLNPRAGSGLLSFCYWWVAGRWYRGQSPSAAECAAAVPGVWTAGTVIEIVTGLVANRADNPRDAVAALVTSAEAGAVAREVLIDVFGDDGRFDIDGARYQYFLAGLLSTEPRPMPEREAISRVRDHISRPNTATTAHPPPELVAHRLDVGWMVYVPAPPGENAIEQPTYYVADDGVLELSSSVAPADYIAEFEQRFLDRQGSTT
ncbi:hypothetical protein [Nocardia sp. NPDC004604]|uniref:hypothetical protein n=1 Tax=Nocardia sp. NPDC004604 TaxID=3157013 RepID=UPI0033BE818F